jgi:hypothetical protein
MHTETSHGMDWWTGSNGNLFADKGDFRYCIAGPYDGGYRIARNGVEIGRAPSVADAKIIVKRAARD